MLFDKLSGIAETLKQNGKPLLYDVVDKSRLFIFPFIPHEVLPKDRCPLSDEFHLPFPVVAVEDRASCVIVADTTDEAFGPNVKRLFIEINDIGGDKSAFRDGAIMDVGGYRESALADGWRYVVTMGSLSELSSTDSGGYTISGSVGTCILAREDGSVIIPGDIQGANELHKNVLGNYVTCLEEIARFSSSDTFILEATPSRVKSSKGRIVRSHYRPVYTVLRPDEIRTRMGIQCERNESNRLVPRPHERRGHWHHFSSERFVNVRGTKKWIDAVWVGPTTSARDGKIYRVVLGRET